MAEIAYFRPGESRLYDETFMSKLFSGTLTIFARLHHIGKCICPFAGWYLRVLAVLHRTEVVYIGVNTI